MPKGQRGSQRGSYPTPRPASCQLTITPSEGQKNKVEMNNVTISLDSILNSLGFLSNSNKRWLAEHLMEQVNKAESIEEATVEKTADDAFFDDLFSTPYDNPQTAEEAKRVIREGRHSGLTRQIQSTSQEWENFK